MTDQQPPVLTPEQTAARTLPVQNPLHELAYEPLMTRLKAAKLEPLFKGLAIALGVMALGNIVMFALVQKAQQETVDLAAKIASSGEDVLLSQGGEAVSDRMAIFAPLAEMIESIKEKERRRDTLLAQNPEYAGNLPIANAPDWRGQAAQTLRAYDDQIDAQLAILAKNADVASADSLAPSSLDAPIAEPAFALPLPTPSTARAAPAPMKQAVAKPAAPKRAAQSAAAKRASDSNYARELTAALNRAARDQAPAGTIGDAAPATPAPIATVAPAVVDTAPIATAAPVAPEAVTPASDELGQ